LLSFDHDCAANTCHHIEWDDRHWNDCASLSLSYSSAEVILGARNDTTFAPFVRSRLFPIDGSKMLKAQNLPR
jgi:hypothetical protein